MWTIETIGGLEQEQNLPNRPNCLEEGEGEIKTKYMVLSRKNNRHHILIVRNMEFMWVKNYKYLGVKLNVSGNNHKEILNKINSDNKCFFGLRTILKYKLLSTRSKLI